MRLALLAQLKLPEHETATEVPPALLRYFAGWQCVRHEERAAGRSVSADRELVLPLTAGSTTPLWERRCGGAVVHPNFFPPPAPWPDEAAVASLSGVG